MNTFGGECLCLREIFINVNKLFIVNFVFCLRCPCSVVVAYLLVYPFFLYTGLFLLSVYYLISFIRQTLLLCFWFFVDHVRKLIIFVFRASVFHIKNIISIFVTTNFCKNFCADKPKMQLN